ncbi:hypothetical protein Ocin01_08406 [Orchesella cincta]|uniref:Synaptic plasticity regulator PANTS n=1 Tax=Orchesella cincta TaxID=48709 RepID=A0A1D2MZ94_ORCCI|nr:hypothetical protein Ocin01_08406 [Orchesella cincta]
MASVADTSSPSVSNLIAQNIGGSSSSESSPSVSSESTEKTQKLPMFTWMVKPCFIYKEEYKDCKSFKARFHQYFVDGKSADCSGWKEDYDNCILWEDKDNIDALNKVIESEKTRVKKRLRAHYDNDIWEHRTEPPSNWNSELPESIKKDYENSFLKKKADELKSGEEKLGPISGSEAGDRLADSKGEGSSCSIV